MSNLSDIVKQPDGSVSNDQIADSTISESKLDAGLAIKVNDHTTAESLAGAGLVANASELDINVDSDDLIIVPAATGNTEYVGNSYIETSVANSSALRFSGDAIYCFEVDPGVLNKTHRTIMYSRDNSSNIDLFLQIFGNGFRGLQFGVRDTAETLHFRGLDGTYFNPSVWNKVVVRVEAGIPMTVMINDTDEIVTDDGNVVGGQKQFTGDMYRLGWDEGNSGRGLDGFIRNLEIYSGTTTDATSWVPGNTSSLAGSPTLVYQASAGGTLNEVGGVTWQTTTGTVNETATQPEEVGIKDGSITDAKLNTTLATRLSTFQEPVADTTALAALLEANLVDRERRYVDAEGKDYYYDSTAGTGDIAPGDQTGGTGFWITAPTIASQSEETLTGRAVGAGSGTPGELSKAQALAILNVEDGAQVNRTLASMAGNGLVVDATELAVSVDSDELIINPKVSGNTEYVSGGYIHTGGSAFKFSGNATYAMEVNIGPTVKSHETIMRTADGKFLLQAFNGSGSNEGVQINVRNAADDAGSSGSTSSALFTTNTWHELILVVEAGQAAKVYVDGVLGFTGTGTLTGGQFLAVTDMYFGHDSATSGRHLEGFLRNVEIYEGATTDPSAWVPANTSSLPGVGTLRYQSTSGGPTNEVGSVTWTEVGSFVETQTTPEEIGVKDSAVTNAKLADMVQDTFKGRATASTGAPEDITSAQARGILNTEAVLTDATTIAWDADGGNSATVTLTDNRTLGNPTNLKAGETYTIRVVQDPTGSRTLAYDTNYKFSTTLASPTLSTAGDAEDILVFYSDGTNMYLTDALLGF